MAKRAMALDALLFTQGFGTRRECLGLVQHGLVQIDGQVVDDPDLQVVPEGLVVRVQGVDWPYRERALVVLHKPKGYEVSRKPKHHPSVLSLLPPPLRQRDVQPVGRLDEDTTGLLLLTDDGALIHRLTSPKRHVPKIYDVGCKHPVDETQIARLLAGVKLVDDPATVQAAAATPMARSDELYGLQLTLTDGKYHQVKRMLAAVGNRVESLHRSGFGALRLPDDLPPGKWRWLSGPGVLMPAVAGDTADAAPAG